jgi:hypothetical protein
MRVPHTGTGRAIFSEYSFQRGTETSATAHFLKQSLKTAAPVAISTVKKSQPNLAKNINGCGRRDFVNGKALPHRSIWCANPQLPI